MTNSPEPLLTGLWFVASIAFVPNSFIATGIFQRNLLLLVGNRETVTTRISGQRRDARDLSQKHDGDRSLVMLQAAMPWIVTAIFGSFVDLLRRPPIPWESLVFLTPVLLWLLAVLLPPTNSFWQPQAWSRHGGAEGDEEQQALLR